MRSLWVVICCCALAGLSFGQISLHAPALVNAGEGIAISTEGSGQGTLYVVGLGHVSKREIQGGQKIQISGKELQKAGAYDAIACGGQQCASTKFYVSPAAAADLSFLVHPSRVPVGQSNAISAIALTFDHFQNLTLQPQSVAFGATTQESPGASANLTTRNGVAWTRLSSSPKSGVLEVTASIGDISERRVVQQIASEPCNLRASAEQKDGRVVLQTDPVRDCRGNAVPDGTIVTFTKLDQSGRSTVDAPIKRGVARTEMEFEGPATISIACGVVVGNDIHMGGGR